MKSRLHVFVSGRVQGVFFRDNTRKIAEKLGLTGWVRNLDDGRVEVLAEGDKERLEKLLSYIRKGPIIAKVTSVDHRWLDFKDEFKGFQVRY